MPHHFHSLIYIFLNFSFILGSPFKFKIEVSLYFRFYFVSCYSLHFFREKKVYYLLKLHSLKGANIQKLKKWVTQIYPAHWCKEKNSKYIWDWPNTYTTDMRILGTGPAMMKAHFNMWSEKKNLSQDNKPFGKDSELATSTTSKHSVTVQFITLYSFLDCTHNHST
jgi:hypothetical protein